MLKGSMNPLNSYFRRMKNMAIFFFFLFLFFFFLLLLLLLTAIELSLGGSSPYTSTDKT